MKTRIEELWDEICSATPEQNVFRRVDEFHPLNLYAGIDGGGHRVLLLVTDVMPDQTHSTGAVDVAVQQREDGDWAIIVRLARHDLAELFGRLCQDLVDTTRSASRVDGAGILLRRLQRWRRLFESRHERSLAEHELRGLLGELWFLEQGVLPRIGPSSAVQAWIGPLDAPQDFLIAGTLVEVKTVRPGAHEIPISSVAQLDVDTPLYLVVVTLAPATAHDEEAFTSELLVSRIRASIDENEAAVNEFALRLAETGYDERAEYTMQWYCVHRAVHYRVGEAFPRLRAKNLPNGVLNLTYDVALNAIRDSVKEGLVIGGSEDNARE